MYEASYGYPPDDPKEVVWMNLREFVARQGPDPEKWAVKPHCPHCKCALDTFDIKKTKDFHLVSAKATQPRRKTGFGHPKGKAKPDCPYSYVNDPRFLFPPSRYTAERERKANREIVTQPKMAAALQEVLRYFMHPMTGEAAISPADQKVLDRLGRMNDHMKGLKKHPWMRPYMQILLFSELNRRARVRKSYKPVTNTAQGEFRESGGELCARKGRKPAESRGNILMWRQEGSQILEYPSINPEDGIRTIDIPTRMQLFMVYPQPDGGVKYVRALSKGQRAITFKISRDFAAGIVKIDNKRRKKQEARAKGRIHGRPKRRKIAPGQSNML